MTLAQSAAWWSAHLWPAAGEALLLVALLAGSLVLVRHMGKKGVGVHLPSVKRLKDEPVSPDAAKGMDDAPIGAQIPWGSAKKWFIFKGYVKVEMTRIKEVPKVEVQLIEGKPTEVRTFEKRRVITARYLVKKTAKVFVAKVGIPHMDYGAYLLDPSALNRDGKIVYDEQFSEPYGADSSEPAWSLVLAKMMANSFAGAAIEVATFFSHFTFSRQHVYIVIIAALIGSLVMGTVAPLLNLVPHLSVHWLPSAPVVK